MISTQSVRPSVLAGMWYPADAQKLSKMIDITLQAVEPVTLEGTIMGLLTPHAGLQYSGPVAAHSFRLATDLQPETVVILCPYHRPPANLYDATIVSSAHSAYRTPLGDVPVDLGKVAVLGDKLPVAKAEHDHEHAIEVVLPILQCIFQHDYAIVPLMLVRQSNTMIQRIGQVLAATCDPATTLLIASSDLSHFFPQKTAEVLDQTILDEIRAFNPNGVLREGAKPGGEGACGYGAIAAVMWACAAWGANRADILHYATSGDTGGDKAQVVGYAAGAFYQEKPA